MNLLGNPDDAEDLVQETMLKWLSMDRPDIENVKGYLVRTLINKGLNFIRDRKRESKQEVEVAPELLKDHLPAWIENSHILSLGFLALLEKLSPTERAVFLLKEVFGYSHREIAALLDISEENCRQILVRAKRHLKNDRQRFTVDPEQHLHLYRTFVRVIQGDDFHKFLEILREDIDLDIARPAAALNGKAAVGDYLKELLGQGMNFGLVWLRGMPAIVGYLLGKPALVIELIGKADRIERLRLQKLSPATQPITA